MGHDILAAATIDTDRLRDHLNSRPSWTTEEWEHRLDDFPHVAHLRRSAYDKYGRVIYRALSAEDMYGGCSGIGESETFARIDIKTALELLPGIVADKAPVINTEMVEHLAIKLGATGTPVNEGNMDIADEQEFLMNILAWMDSNKHDTVEVYFG